MFNDIDQLKICINLFAMIAIWIYTSIFDENLDFPLASEYIHEYTSNNI